MYVPHHLQAFYRELSHGRQDSGRIYDAMMQATKGSFQSVHARKVCNLLVTLRRCSIATNDVEHGVRRCCRMLSDKRKMIIKMDIMQKKIMDAFRDMVKKQIESAKIWRESKKLIDGDLRVRYLNKWRDSVKQLKQKVGFY